MIDAKRIDEIFLGCLLADDEVDRNKPPEKQPKVPVLWGEGITFTKAAFSKERIESHREEIKGYLKQLPAQFHKGTGDGWTFLNACDDRNGSQWGEHRNIEQLFALGIALGYATFLLPREMWSALPGGVPMVGIDIAPKHQDKEGTNADT